MVGHALDMQPNGALSTAKRAKGAAVVACPRAWSCWRTAAGKRFLLQPSTRSVLKCHS